MSKEFDNTNTGALFRSDKKLEAIKQGDTDAEKWADHNGTLNVGGREYWINAWVRTSSKSGKKFFSLSVKPKDAGPERKPNYSKTDTVARQTAAEEMDDDVPF